MWIKYIKLENFASIKVGLKKKKIEIDFSNRKNNICLLVAPNGMGKTSLLSTLTPFAGLGNLDVRDNHGLIIKGKQGYKEIHIVNDNKEYVIEHHYSPNKETHSVKSYIRCDGYEYNINGNVRSFIEVVEKELGIEPSFLKLLRLGNNVTNLIKLSATERKHFLGNLLQELDIYLGYHKKLTMDARLLKSELGHINDKLQKTGIIDLDETESKLNEIRNLISSYSDNKESLLESKGAVEFRMNDLDIVAVRESVKSCSKEINKASKFNKPLDLTADACSNKISYLKDKLSGLNDIIVSNTTGIKHMMKSCDELYGTKKKLEIELEKEETNEELLSAQSICNTLTDELIVLDKKYKSYTPVIDKITLEQFMIELNECNKLINKITQYGNKPIKKVYQMISMNIDVENYVNNQLYEITDRGNGAFYLLNKFMERMIEIPSTCENYECGLRCVHMEIQKMIKSDYTKSDNEEEYYRGMDHIHKVLKHIIDTIIKNKDIIERLPKELRNDFNEEPMIKLITKEGCVYNKEKYNDLLSEVTEYHIYLEKKNSLLEAQAKLNFIKKNSKSEYIKELLEDTNRKITDMNKVLINRKNEALGIEALYKEEANHLDTLEAMYIRLTTYDSLVQTQENNHKLLEEYSKLSLLLDDYNTKLFDLTNNIIKCTQMESNIIVSIEQYKTLYKDYKRISKLYDENTYIKKTFSAQDGIPLEFIQSYMCNIQSIINELLEIVYDDSLYIEGFDINTTEFKIPYIKDGYKISDISQASQGETSFLSIALSFALIAQSIMKYNVILLDEIDGNLDASNRKKFLYVLERLIELIGAEQIFLISHNNLFSMYPVDVLSLENREDSSLTLANYIKLE